jgi:hypothetical protein
MIRGLSSHIRILYLRASPSQIILTTLHTRILRISMRQPSQDEYASPAVASYTDTLAVTTYTEPTVNHSARDVCCMSIACPLPIYLVSASPRLLVSHVDE